VGVPRFVALWGFCYRAGRVGGFVGGGGGDVEDVDQRWESLLEGCVGFSDSALGQEILDA
jgi:hypothetical protein